MLKVTAIYLVCYFCVSLIMWIDGNYVFAGIGLLIMLAAVLFSKAMKG